MNNFGSIRKLRKLNQLVTVFFMCMLGCQPFAYADQLALPSTDLIAPEGEHEPIKVSPIAGQNLIVSANVVDNIAVSKVTLFYRTIGTEDFSATFMNKSGAISYSVTLSGELVAAPGIEYYIQAEDEAGNTRTFGYQFSPYIVKVIPSGEGQGLDLDFDGTDYEDEALFPVAAAAVAVEASFGAEEESIFTNKWLWIGLGVLVAAVVGGGGGGDDGASNDPTVVSTTPGITTVTITAPAP